jgi:hypothetical protein
MSIENKKFSQKYSCQPFGHIIPLANIAYSGALYEKIGRGFE